MEIKSSVKRMEKIRKQCGFFNGIDIGTDGSKRGLFLGWKTNDVITLCSYSNSHIDVEVYDENDNNKCRLTGFYGHPEERMRESSLNMLCRLGRDHTLSRMVVGDFNEIAYSFEKSGG